jgi:uncharacterized phage-associated protein
MSNAFDTASYILKKQGPMSAMKLQKLVYYSQAWSLVWDEAPLFNDEIQAWANGPVLPKLYEAHRGEYLVTPALVEDKAENNLNETQKETIDTVLKAYGEKSAQWLSDQTHNEAPWVEAREGLRELERSNKEITPAAMAEYYSTLG